MTGPSHLSRTVSRRILAIHGPRIGGARGAILAPVELIRGRLPASEKGVRLNSNFGRSCLGPRGAAIIGEGRRRRNRRRSPGNMMSV